MKYVVAVSGGVDSVALLDMMVRQYAPENIIVAHFDHGIREVSGDDAMFVQRLSESYGCKFKVAREELGADASEAAARERRYLFLNNVAREYGAVLAAAHHLDDLVETVVLNLQRGTEWRGLTPFGQDMMRPLLYMTKGEIIEYAKVNALEWREDETNTSMRYARNRVRPAVAAFSLEKKLQVAALYARQWEIRRAVESEVEECVGVTSQYSRYFFIMAPIRVRLELLRGITQGRLTYPQLARVARSVCTARHGSVIEAGGGVEVHFTTRQFTLKLLKLNKDT